MSRVTWRQYRLPAAIAALLAAFATVMLVTGLQVASQWHSALTACTADHTCGGLPGTLSLGSHAVGILVIMTLGVPALLGMLLGARFWPVNSKPALTSSPGHRASRAGAGWPPGPAGCCSPRWPSAAPSRAWSPSGPGRTTRCANAQSSLPTSPGPGRGLA